MRTIRIRENRKGGYDVIDGDRYVDRLMWDEMLGQIATITHPDIKRPRYAMFTARERIAQQRIRNRKNA